MHTYDPHKSFGPFRFGMSVDEAISILGQPTVRATMLEHLELAEQLSEGIGDTLSTEQREYLEGWQGFEFPDSESRNNNPNLLFHNSELVMIRLINTRDSLEIFDIDVFDGNRKRLIWQLFDLDGKIFVNNEDYYFPNLGLMTSYPSYWREQGHVSFVDRSYVDKFVNAMELEELTEPDFKRPA